MKAYFPFFIIIALLTLLGLIARGIDKENKREIAHHVCSLANLQVKFLSDGVGYTCIRGDTQ